MEMLHETWINEKPEKVYLALTTKEGLSGCGLLIQNTIQMRKL